MSTCGGDPNCPICNKWKFENTFQEEIPEIPASTEIENKEKTILIGNRKYRRMLAALKRRKRINN